MATLVEEHAVNKAAEDVDRIVTQVPGRIQYIRNQLTTLVEYRDDPLLIAYTVELQNYIDQAKTALTNLVNEF